MTDREFALDVVRKLQEAGFTALWAGGCVRDELLGLTPADYDVATDARPEQLRPLFRRRNEIGASFGVVQVIGPRGDDGEWLTIEVATFRSDVSYTDGRRPDAVVFSSPEDDAKRRDFTINGMFFDPVKDKLIDYVGGRADLDAKILRAIGDPVARFTEDKLRILRAVRMATRFDLRMDSDTLLAAKRMASEIRVVSAERIAEELRKMLVHPNRARALLLLREFELIEPVLRNCWQLSHCRRDRRLLRMARSGTTPSAWWRNSAAPSPFPWRSRQSYTMSVSRASSAAPPTSTRSTATSTSAERWLRPSRIGSSFRPPRRCGSPGWSRSTCTSPTQPRCASASSSRS